MLGKLSVTEALERLKSAHRRLSAQDMPTNEMARYALDLNLTVIRLRDAVLVLLESQASLICLMDRLSILEDEDAPTNLEVVDEVKPADDVGGQSEETKPAVDIDNEAGGNGGGPAKV